MCHHSSSDEACTNPLSDSMNKDSSGSRAVTLFKLPLQLVEESNACIDLSVGEDKTIKLSSTSTSMLVYVDWSQELLEKYDIHYLENLPEVFKYGPVNKKARTEPLSLYTCLEGFLREEPLVPEDMWLVSILPQRTIFNCNADQSLVDISLVGIFLMHLDVIELFILHVEGKGVALKD
jgi:ubiquitin carboxyl-terminal hydrolase 4/11/15